MGECAVRAYLSWLLFSLGISGQLDAADHHCITALSYEITLAHFQQKGKSGAAAGSVSETLPTQCCLQSALRTKHHMFAQHMCSHIVLTVLWLCTLQVSGC